MWLAAGFAAGSVLALGLAFVVYRARPARQQNRALALLLLVEGLSSTGAAVQLSAESVDIRWAGLYTFFLFWIGTLAIYPVFLGTLDSPLARPLRRWPVLGVFWLACATLAGLMFVAPDRFLVGPFVLGDAAEFAYGPWAQAAVMVSLPLLLYAFSVTLSAWRRAPTGSARRDQAKAYAAAFLVRDALLLVSVANFLVLPWFVADGLFGTVDALVIGRTVYIAQIVSFPLIAGYGILKHQLFDIDLKVKFALEKSTIAAIFAVAFLAGSEIVERLLGVEGLWFGVGAAVGVGLFFQRVERLAGAVANRVMPGVKDTEDYRTVRRAEFYRAAVESALVDGEITPRERRVLETMAQQLGLSPAHVLAIEQKARTMGVG